MLRQDKQTKIDSQLTLDTEFKTLLDAKFVIWQLETTRLVISSSTSPEFPKVANAIKLRFNSGNRFRYQHRSKTCSISVWSEVGIKSSPIFQKLPKSSFSLFSLGGRHSSVVSSAPTILRLRVQIPSTPSMLFLICIIEIVTRKERKWNQKRPELAQFKKKTFFLF